MKRNDALKSFVILDEKEVSRQGFTQPINTIFAACNYTLAVYIYNYAKAKQSEYEILFDEGGRRSTTGRGNTIPAAKVNLYDEIRKREQAIKVV